MVIRIFPLLIVLFLFSACAAPAAAPTVTLPPTAMATATAAPTATRPPDTATPTAAPTFTPLPPTLTPSEIPTPIPTLSPEDTKALLFGLLADNGGCQLPCLWGFIPGQTEIETVRAWVNQIGIGDRRVGDIEIGAHDYGDAGVGGVGISYSKDSIYIVAHLSYAKSRETSRLESLSFYAYPMEDRGPDPTTQVARVAPIWGDDAFNEELQDYLLSSILTTYGQPSQVLLTVMPDSPNRPDIEWHPFSLALVYLEKGIYIEYVSLRETKGNKYVGCPGSSHIYLSVWEPHNNWSLKDIVEGAGSEIIFDYMKPLEEATSLTLDEFYQTFKNPENTTCVETPSELWPVP